jgi:hypothetical protein
LLCGNLQTQGSSLLRVGHIWIQNQWHGPKILFTGRASLVSIRLIIFAFWVLS